MRGSRLAHTVPCALLGLPMDPELGSSNLYLGQGRGDEGLQGITKGEQQGNNHDREGRHKSNGRRKDRSKLPGQTTTAHDVRRAMLQSGEKLRTKTNPFRDNKPRKCEAFS